MESQILPRELPIKAAGVSKGTLLTVLWAGVGISLVFVLSRAYIRLRIFRKFSTDDYFVALAWTSTLINAILWQFRAPQLYFGTAVAVGEITQYPANLAQIMEEYLRAILASYIVQIAGLWSVKLSMLFFFRGLGIGIRQQEILWWCTFAFLFATLAVCLGTIDYGCLTSTFPGSLEKCTKPSTRRYEYISIRVYTALDVSTDASIIGLSTNILWRVRINWGRKLALIGICSLTAFVIAVSIIRVALSTHGSNLDLTVVLLWGGIELSVAVIVACLASFRTLYTATRNQKSKEDSRNKPYSFGKTSGKGNSLNDEIPLNDGPSNHRSKICAGHGYWGSQTPKSGTTEDLREEPDKIYRRTDYGVYGVDQSV